MSRFRFASLLAVQIAKHAITPEQLVENLLVSPYALEPIDIAGALTLMDMSARVINDEAIELNLPGRRVIVYYPEH